MNNILIKGGTVVTMNPARQVLETDILIQGDRITAMAPDLSQHLTEAEVIDATGQVVIPGLIQSHIHLTQTLFRGLADDLELLDWLKERIWPFEAAHTAASNAISARLGAAELIAGGTTSVIDMGTVHHTDAIFETMRDVGLRGLLGKCLMDYGPEVPAGLMQDANTALAESEALLQRWHESAGGRLRYAFAPRFAVSCTTKLMEQVRDRARHHGVSMHTHSSENRGEIALVEKERGKRNVHFFHDIGMTGPDVILAHCIWLDESEMRVLADTGTHAVHCPSSNMKLASGIAMVPELLNMGVNMALGCDGPPCNNNFDAFLEMRHAALLQKVRTLSPTALPAMQVLEMATLNGAKAMRQEADLGSLEVGKKADMAILDLRRTHTAPTVQRDPVAAVVYSATAHNVTHTVVDGQVLYRQGRHTTLHVDDTLREAEKLCGELLK